MPKFIFVFSAVSGALAVALGAFGAHALKSRLEAVGRMETYQTAVHYQFYHTLALLAIGVLMNRYASHWLVYSAYSMMVGIAVFSGSLYLLCLTNTKWLGAITPLGGLAFILGWVFLTIAALKIQF